MLVATNATWCIIAVFDFILFSCTVSQSYVSALLENARHKQLSVLQIEQVYCKYLFFY